MSFNCNVCGTFHYADMAYSRMCEVCRQRFCYNFDPPASNFHHTCGSQTGYGVWKCDTCTSNPPKCTYGPECKNELVEGEYTPCKACMRPMCGDHMQTSEICEQCWKAGRRTPFVDAVLRNKGWNVQD